MDTNKTGSSGVTATLRFLTDAGHLLATTAPETSAYLMSQRNDLMFEHEIPLSNKDREHVCSCCGHIMLPGKGSNLQVSPEKRPKLSKRALVRRLEGKEAKMPAPRPRQSGPTKAVICGHCSKRTEIALPAPAPISRRKVEMAKSGRASAPGGGSSLTQTIAAGEPTSQQPKASANASSKRRAKSRKAGLQALLSQSGTPKPGLGLSLADFMER
ncbi:hypothetical protein VTK26DRAFT_5125 [Humicola hyalothermophila]